MGAPAHQLEVTRSGNSWSATAPTLGVGTWTLANEDATVLGELLLDVKTAKKLGFKLKARPRKR